LPLQLSRRGPITLLVTSNDRSVPQATSDETAVVRRSELLAGLSYALDLTEGQRPGHAVRTTLIGMRMADVLGLSAGERPALFCALLLKDLGCSSNSARFATLFGHDDRELKATLKDIDWTRALESFRFVARSVAPGHFWHKRVWKFLGLMARGPEGSREVVRTRCERGAEIATLIGLPEPTTRAIRALDEHWDGRGQPYQLSGEAIPLYGRIAGLAQTLEVFVTSSGVRAGYDMAMARRGRWFEPTLVDALRSFRSDPEFWRAWTDGDELARLRELEPSDAAVGASEDELDRIVSGFAQVIDAKSPWTYRHSEGVAQLADAMAQQLDWTPQDRRRLRRAALLHDLGKLGVSNLILDKPDRLDDRELALIRQHPRQTEEILRRVACLRPILDDAASHHERLDGHGYHRGLPGSEIPPGGLVLSVADICDALRASRPYREGLPDERVLAIVEREKGVGLDPACIDALTAVLSDLPPVDAQPPAAHLVAALAEDYTQAA